MFDKCMQITVQDVKSTGIHSEGGTVATIYFQMHIGSVKNLNGMGRRV